jgi:hypothetical protein
LIDFIKKLLIVTPPDRPNLIGLQGHMWIRGVEHVRSIIAPRPICFHNVRSLTSITKLKRVKETPSPAVLRKCVELGIDEAQLIADLESGETTTATTTYFVLCNPVSERPGPRKPPPAPPPDVSRLASFGNTTQRILPGLNNRVFKEDRRGSALILSTARLVLGSDIPGGGVRDRPPIAVLPRRSADTNGAQDL